MQEFVEKLPLFNGNKKEYIYELIHLQGWMLVPTPYYKKQRRASNWRYRTIKKYKHKAQKFLENATTPEQREAWTRVINWYNSILDKKRMDSRRVIGLGEVEVED